MYGGSDKYNNNCYKTNNNNPSVNSAYYSRNGKPSSNEALDLSCKSKTGVTYPKPSPTSTYTEDRNTSKKYESYVSNNSYVSSNSYKPTRPFKEMTKTYPSPVILSGYGQIQIYDKDYESFRMQCLAQTQSVSSSTNKNMRRTSYTASNEKSADPDYWQKRQKNNLAAKKSREARRQKEDEMAIRCKYLERQNLELKNQLMRR